MKTATIIAMLLICGIHGPVYATELKPYQGDIPATDFVLRDLYGKSHQLHDYQGKVVLLNFWATWCPPCVEELPSLNRLQQHFNDQSVAIITIDVGEPASQIKPFLQKTDSDELSVLMDMDGKVHKQWNIYVFPTSFLLDQSGNIQYAAVGALDWSDSAIINTINQLLRRKNSDRKP